MKRTGGIFLVLGMILASVTTGTAATWRAGNAMGSARVYQAATLLPNGKILVSGGQDGSGTALSSSELYDPVTGQWAATGSMSSARYRHTATLLANGKVLVTGGQDSSDNALAGSEIYDPTTGSWSSAGSMSAARVRHAAILLADGRLLVAGGQDNAGNPLSSADLYDPAAAQWSATGAMGSKRYFHAAVLLANGRVLVAGGEGESGFLASAEVYDPSGGTWAATGAMTVARRYHSATLLANGKVLAAGGLDAGASAELYNPSAGTWAATGSMSVVRLFHAAILMPNGRVLAVGGNDASGTGLSSTEIYDPGAGTWASAGSMSAGRYDHSATMLANGKVLAAGGQNNSGASILSSAELYDPAPGSWASAAALSKARAGQTSTFLPAGKVLVAGGSGDTTAEIYDPSANAWTASVMKAARRNHATVLLSSGAVLTAGGVGSSSVLMSAEIYDPTANSWALTGAMISSRAYHTASLLASGLVLAAGGQDNSGGVLSSAETFDPTTNAWTATGSLASTRSSHAAAPLANAQVLVEGGRNDAGTVLASAEIYSSRLGTWASAGVMNTARSTHTATLLFNGQVLAAGGRNSSGNALSSAELYDPVANSWSTAAPMNTARLAQAAMLLPNGKVLVAGGQDSAGSALSSAEIYDPAANSWTAMSSMNVARSSPTLTLLTSGKVLAVGGNSASSELVPYLEYDYADVLPSLQPAIASISQSLTVANSVSVTGSSFTGVGEGSGGNGHQDSPADLPRAYLLDVQGGGLVDVSTSIYTHSLSATALSFDVPASLAKGYYYFWVQSNAVPSTFSVVRVLSPAPPAPGAPTGTALGISSVSWSWSAVAGAYSYNVYTATGATLLASTTTTSYYETGLGTDTAAGLQVAAVNDSGSSLLSPSATTYTLAAPPTATLAVVLTSASAQVQWTEPALWASSFSVARSTYNGGFVQVGQVGDVSQFSDSGLAAATTYYYRVRALNGDGLPTDYDAVSSTRTYAPVPGAPALSAVTVSSGSVFWSWAAAGGQADTVRLFTSTGALVAQLPGTTTTYLETGISTFTLSSRYLQAANPSGQACSSTATVATPHLTSYAAGLSSNTLRGETDPKKELDIPSLDLSAAAVWIVTEDPVDYPLTSQTTTFIAAANNALPAGARGPSGAMAEFILAVNDARSTGTLTSPLTLKLPYTDNVNPGFVDGVSPPARVDALQIYWLNETTGLWEPVPGSSVDQTNKVVTASVSHLSIYTALSAGAAGDLSGVRVYPVPYRPNGGSADQGLPYSSSNPASGIVFDHLPQTATIKIYTVTGQLVTELNSNDSSGTLRWDARNGSGRDVATGGYLAVITSPGVAHVTKKLLIIR